MILLSTSNLAQVEEYFIVLITNLKMCVVVLEFFASFRNLHELRKQSTFSQRFDD